MKKNQNLRAIQVQRFLRYSIRKFTVGVASVAIASGLAVLGGTNAQAAEEVNTPATETKAPDAGKNIKKDVAEKVNTSKLSEAIERLSQLLVKVKETEKTTATITAAKELLSKAQQAVSRSDIQQLEVDKFTSELTSKAFVLESMPKEKDKKTEKEADKSTEEKVNKNQDPRNGKAIPGKDESGFRTDTSSNNGTTTVTNDVLTPTTPAQPTAKNIIGSTSTVSRENFTGWDTYKMPFGVQSGSGTLGVDSAEQKANAEGLQFRVFSDQRAGTRVTPGPSNFTFELKASDVKARVDYGLKLPAEEVQKIIEEAPLWSGKLRYDNTRLQRAAASTYFGGGPYEYLMSSIYKLGYEQGIDKVYVKDASKRIEVTEEAKAAGWTVSDFTVSNMPGGLVYDKQSDSIQGVVTHGSPFNYQKLVATVTFTNTKTGKNVRIPLDLHRYGGTAWKDGTPPTLEINDAVKEGKVGEELVVPVEYRDAGASHAGAPNGRNIPYNLTDENGNPLNRTATIRETVGRAILGVSGVKITGTTGAGASTVTDLTGDDTKIPGVGFTIASNDMTERNKNGFKGTPTEAGIYRVSIYARDYKETNANEAYAHATFKISPAVSVKNVHAYDKEVPITISRGASEATITLPDGTNTKIVAKNGKWVVSETTNTAVNVNDEIGTVGETFNLKVLPTATAKAATDNINVTASSENVTATFTRAEVALKTRLGENVTATFNKVTGRWDLPAEIAEKKTVNSDGTTTWLKRDLYVDVDKNGETIFNVYEYIRTLNAEGKVTAVSDPTRTLTTYNKENAANSAAESANDTNKGMIVTVKYDKGLNKWTADDNSTVTATKTGDKWTISTSSGFNGTVDAVHAESTDKASVLNDVPTVHSTSYTTVKGAIVDLVKQKSATVTITDREDDATTAPNKKETTVTKVTLTAPSGKVTEYTSLTAAAAVKLTETGEYTVKVDVKDSNGNKVTADSDTATGTNENDNSAVASRTYVITVKDQETNKLYKVEDDTVTNDELKAKVNPTTVDGFTPSKNDITDIPTTTGKAGQTLPIPATVTYTKDTETIQVETKVDVVVLPKVTPTGVTVLKDSTNLENLVKEKAKEAAKAIATDKIPTGVTVSIKEVKAGTLPGTTTIGDQTPAKVVVEYKDANNNVVETREVEVPVTVIGSTANKIVKFKDDELTDEEVKVAVTPGTNGTKGEPLLEANITAEPGTKEVAIPVTYNNGELTERVVVPVVVLPTATGEVEVPKGSTVEKVKETAKAKATEVATSADFKAKLPEGSKDVVVGEITQEVLATMTAEKGTNKGIVKVPVTYTVDGKSYTKEAEITVNVLGSEPKTVYTVEGKKLDAEKVKNAVTPGTGGTVNAPKETDLPATTVKAGTPDVTVPTTVTYPTGDETVNVPVEVLPKATPEKVTTLKDTTSENLTTAVKEKAQAALGKLTLPSGVTVELVPNQDYTVPATTSNGDKDNVPVKVQYKDATGTVVAEDTINVPVTVVSSTPSKIVVFEGDEVTADAVKGAVTPGTDGTKGTPVIPTDLTKQSGEKEVTLPVAYDGITDPEQVKVPVTVLSKTSGEADVPKGSTVDKVKEVAKAKASALVEEAAFKGKLPTGATVTVGDITEAVAETLTNEKGTNKGVVNVPATYTVDGKEYPTTVPVTINVLGSEPKTVYTVEGKKLDAEKVKNAVTPGTGGTVNAPKETDLPATTVKAGTPDVTVPTTVTYPTGDETVNVPVEVLPKATPEKVTTLKDTTSENLTTAVKEKAQAALGKLTLPSGVTVELVPNQDYTVPATTSNGDKDNVPVKVQYKDATGTVVAEDTINVPVTVVSSTPSKIVVFEGDEVTADAVKGAVTPGTDGTKGTPVIPTDLTKQSGEKEVTLPVAYDGITEPEQVKVPVTVLPKATGEVEVPKGSAVDKVKEVAKAKATELVEAADFKGKLPTGATVTVGDITEAVAETLTNEKGTNKGVVNVPATYTVDGKTYNTTVPVTINVLGSEPKTVYTVEGTKPDAEKVKNAVTPGTGGTVGTPTETDLPETTGKVGAKDVTVPTTVTYPSGTETVNVPVEVLPKATPEKVITLKDTTGENLTTAVKEKAQAALGKLTLPSGVTAELDPNQTYTVPATDSNGDKNNVPVKVQYKDATGTVVAEDTINVPVTVVGSTPKPLVVFEGDTVEAKTVQDAVTTGTDGTKGNPAIPEDLTKTPGKKEATVPVTYEGIKDPEQVKVPVTVLPKPEAEEILVAKNSDKEKAKEKVLAKAKKAIEDATFKGKLPQDATVTVDETVPVTVPDLTEDTEVDVTVKYTVPGQDTPLTTTVKVPVTVVEGVPQIVPVKENNDVLPDPEKNIDKEDYPEGSTFRYKTPEGQTTPIDVTTPGDKDVIVEVLDKNGNPIAEVPATVRVVESYPKYVPVDPAKKQPDPKENINPNEFPSGTTFEYKNNTPVDTTTPGEKPVTVVAKLNGQPIAEIPATIVVVEPKTQYVPVNAENDKKPKPKDSITPDDYPEGSTFEYKTPEGQATPYDGTTPGEKDVTVVVKDSDGDTVVEVPAKIKVVQGKEQLTPVNAEDKDKPKAEDSITPSDYPEGSTFEYKVPEGQTTPYDGTTPGDKPVTVVVKDKNGNVLVEVPTTIKVVESKPTPIETPVTTTPLKEEDYTKGLNIPDGATAKVGDLPDLTTPGEKTPVKVMITLPNGKSYTVDVPVTVTPVKEIETPVTTEKLTPEDILKQIKVPEGATTNVGDLPDLTTPGKKDPVKVTVTLPNGKVVTVDVPVNVTPVKEIETPVTTTPLTPEDYTKGITIPEGGKVTKVENIPDLTTPGKKDPVKVTVELPNGKVVTVDVPVNVTPVKEIETPVTTTPLTPEDYTKGITIPEGGKVTKVENIPDLTTPGKKTPVKVTIELPNGKVVTVDVPVNVTPVKEIETPVTKDKLTPEDILKQIKVPEGATTKVENIPDLTTPGKKDPVKVTITLPNGKVVTVEVPVNVTPVKEIETPVTKDKLTPEDILKQIKVPEGATTKVENIPDLTTPGKKDPVKVTITLPNGKVVIVEIPVTVTPIEGIVKKGGDPITNEDVEKHIPKGAKIISIGDKPTTDVPGERPSIPVVIELPNGIRVTMNIPVIVTPKVTPIVVEVGTPITKEDVKKKVGLPEGWGIVEIGEIPTTETPGTKPVIKVKVKLPDGRIITVEVPVIVTPKSQNGGGIISQNGDSTVQIVTEYLDENGKRITSDKEGKHNPIELEGYEFSHSTTDAKGNTLHHYKKVTPKTPQAVEEVPAAKPEQPSTPEVKSTPVAKQELPNTGTAELEVFTPAVLAILTGLGLAAPTVAKKKDEE